MRLENEDLYEPRDYSIRRPRRSSRKLLKVIFGFGLIGLTGAVAGQMLADATEPAMTTASAPRAAAPHAPATARAALPPAIPHIRQASLIDPGFLDGAAALAFGRNVALRAEHAARKVLLANLNPQVQVTDPVSEEDAEDREIKAAENSASATTRSSTAAAPAPTPRPADLAALPAFPAPPPRPGDLAIAAAPEKPAPDQRMASQAQPKGRVVTASAPAQQAGPDGGSFLEKLFGGSRDASGPQLAYANPQEGAVRDYANGMIPGAAGSSFDKFTAIYDISSRTVHLPNGAKLEAHSGLGQYMDDPRNVHLRMRGATPPALYDLKEREALFHGVRAIRLTPINSAVHGRSGLLAHTYMLGPSGQSNGCVSFRNYDAFLQAFLRGEVKRLAVVAKL